MNLHTNTCNTSLQRFSPPVYYANSLDTFHAQSELADPESIVLLNILQFEICVNFLTGYFENERYCDDLRLIARHYIASPFRFWFDVVTSVPLAWIDWGILQVIFFPFYSEYANNIALLNLYICLKKSFMFKTQACLVRSMIIYSIRSVQSLSLAEHTYAAASALARGAHLKPLNREVEADFKYCSLQLGVMVLYFRAVVRILVVPDPVLVISSWRLLGP